MSGDTKINGIKTKYMEEMTLSKKFVFGIRHVQMICMNLCIMMLFMGRSSISVAVLAMTDVTRQNDTNVEIYDWDKKTQGVILSSFFWGYMTMQIPAGLLAKKYGGKLILLVALIANGACCILLPTLAHYGGWICVCVCRVCMGLTQACLFPASHTLLGRWLPSSERTSLSALVYGGGSIGTIISMPVSGVLADTSLGWKMIFYFTAGMMLLMSFFWFWFAASTPGEHRLISDEEKDYIEMELNTGHQSKQNRPTPWGDMFRTVPVWAILVAHVASVVCYTLFFNELPTYLEHAMHISLKNSANLSALPHLGMLVGSVGSSAICEKIYNRGLLSVGTCRKLFNSIACFGAAAGCISLAFLSRGHENIAVLFLTATLFLAGFTHSGFMVNHLDLSPHFAGVMFSITNFASSIGGIATPVVTSFILYNDPTNISRWRIVFFLVAGIMIVANIFYVIFSSADRVSWDSQEYCDKRRATLEELKPLQSFKNIRNQNGTIHNEVPKH